MILNDTELLHYLQRKQVWVEPFDESKINPASYDIHLGNKFQIATKTRLLDPRSEQSIRDNFEPHCATEFIAEPGQFFLGTSVETIFIPDYCVGVVCGKSSVARLGWAVENAGYIDPGFCGEITFEITNQHPSPNLLYAGMPFAQIYLFEIHPCRKSYAERNSSKYRDQKGATLSKMHLNHGISL